MDDKQPENDVWGGVIVLFLLIVFGALAGVAVAPFFYALARSL